jgi:hypothetical protein
MLNLSDCGVACACEFYFRRIVHYFVCASANPVCRTLDPLAAKKGAGCFPRNSQWPALFDHCVREHPKACEDMERLTPAQIAEMRARMSMRKS